MNDYWDNDEEYDEVAASLKEALQKSVKAEVTERIEKLTTENRELRVKLQKLDALEADAKAAKYRYEREFATAKHEAQSAARKEKLVEILAAIDERLYTVETERVALPKCDKCDSRRRISYTTPLGKDAEEACDCAESHYRYVVREVVAHEVSRRHGKLVIWWAAIKKYGDGDSLSGRVLESSEGVELATLVKGSYGYAFKDSASAQTVADAANKQKEASNGD
jgi:hypothetical protein